MLPDDKLQELKAELDSAVNPLFVFDKDTDGLCSFLQLYHYKGEGNYFPIKTRDWGANLLYKVKSYQPDKVFFLDIPTIPQEFVDELNIPAIQIDHHLGGEEVKGLKIFNPRTYDKADASPTSTICYNVVKHDLWLCAVGTIADWFISKETKEFAQLHPDLLDGSITVPDTAMFESKIGLLGQIFNFVLKGKSEDVDRNIELVKSIKSPEEILDQTTENGKELYKRFRQNYEVYERTLKEAEEQISDEKVFVFIYQQSEITFSTELANELIHKHKDKIIIVGRIGHDEYKMSLRGDVEIRSKLLKALEGLDGDGGGHDKACGAHVAVKDFDTFLERYKAQFE